MYYIQIYISNGHNKPIRGAKVQRIFELTISLMPKKATLGVFYAQKHHILRIFNFYKAFLMIFLSKR